LGQHLEQRQRLLGLFITGNILEHGFGFTMLGNHYDATCDLDLRSPPSNHFEKLRGNLAGKHSIRVNKQWLLVFAWHGERGEAQDIYLDNHDYR